MKILFIGNRINVLKSLMTFDKYDINIFALENSYLSQYLIKENIKHFLFASNEKERIIEILHKNSYEVIISNGCPFILPILHDKMYNIHPTYLPHLRGKTPLNGVILKQLGFIGSTMHRISSKIDGGNIIHQEKVMIGEDIDLGLIYYLSFHLEGHVFLEGWKKLIAHNFIFEGIPMNTAEGSYYNRNEVDPVVNFKTMKSKEILLRIKAFGIKTQGAIPIGLQDCSIKKIFDAELIINEYLNNMFFHEEPGVILHHYDNKILVKTLDGLMKLKSYE